MNKTYKVITSSIATRTYIFEAKSETDAREKFLSGEIDYSYDDIDYHEESIHDVEFHKYEERENDR